MLLLRNKSMENLNRIKGSPTLNNNGKFQPVRIEDLVSPIQFQVNICLIMSMIFIFLHHLKPVSIRNNYILGQINILPCR